MATPTMAQFGNYQKAFDYFNRELFVGKLPQCMLNLSRAAKVRGFYWPARWENAGEKKEGEPTKLAEISLNPDELHRPAKLSMSTLVHEMAHHWQEIFGKPSRSGYHNLEWAHKMISLGLYPSSTGEPGGKMVGDKVTHYIVENGPYERAFNKIPQDILLPWSSFASEKPKQKKPSKNPYQCPVCQSKVWGRPGMSIICGECDEAMEQQ